MARIRILPLVLQAMVVTIWYAHSFSMQRPPQPQPSSSSSTTTGESLPLSSSQLIHLARSHLSRNETDAANDLLLQAVATNHGAISSTPGLLSCFRELFEKRILLLEDTDPAGVAIERIGLASLLCDQGRYSDAVQQLKAVAIDTNPNVVLPGSLQEKASAMLFRTKSAICDWEDYNIASEALMKSVETAIATNKIPAVHPFESLMIPCLTLETSTSIAKMYAKRAIDSSELAFKRLSVTVETPELSRSLTSSPPSSHSQRRNLRTQIKIGYISPDFTGKHPLAFLLQDMFRFHDKSQFEVYIYSVFEEPDGSAEVKKIVDSADKWTVLPPSFNSLTSAKTIRADGIDILIDLCGYTGTSAVAEIMAHRPAPLQIAYMGFPSSSGAPFIDFMICDQTVVPYCFRRHYTESLIIMPHSYFVNSHMFLQQSLSKHGTTTMSRNDHGLPRNGFVFCCHSRPEKIDPVTFMCWVRTVKMIREEGVRNGNPRQAQTCLWILRSDVEMEVNVRAAADVDDDDRLLVFADKVPREEHLQRLKLADLFLDTPSYGAHTVGCDCLSAGVPLLTLLREDEKETLDSNESILTEKLSSRVGASLVKALGEETGLGKDLIVPTMEEYGAVMARAARDEAWFSSVRQRVEDACTTSTPLFDTQRWLSHLEEGLQEAWAQQVNGEVRKDVYVSMKED
jgi:protein O-GlcNAc transferase